MAIISSISIFFPDLIRFSIISVALVALGVGGTVDPIPCFV
jgi:hypothetical protein